MEIEDPKFRYAGVCAGHNTKFVVRSVVALPENYFASSAADPLGTIKVWKRSDSDSSYTCISTLTGHGKSVGGVGALAFIPPATLHHRPEFQKGVLVSGAYDNKIALWSEQAWQGQMPDAAPTQHLVGHEKGVTALTVSHDGLVLSGSIDCTAMLWDPRQSPPRVAKLTGHQYPIWGVAFLDNGDLATASGDRKIKIWDRLGNLKATIDGHEDTVRGLCNIPGLGFLSCCNDFAVRLYAYDGTLLHRLDGHLNFTFCSTQLASGEFATASDDCTVRIWRDFTCVEVLQHPTGVWEVCQLTNGDLVSAGQDGLVYTWSRNPERVASAEAIQALESAVHVSAERALEASQPKKETLGGKQYDIVIPIEVDNPQGGVMQLKLGYNLTDNPHTVATSFCHAHRMSVAQFKDAIVQHIIKLTQHMARPAPTSPEAPATPANNYFLKFEKEIVFDTNINLAACEAKLLEFSNVLAGSSEPALALSPGEQAALPLITAKLVNNSMYHAIDFTTEQYYLPKKLLTWPSEKLFPVLDLIRVWALHDESARAFYKDSELMGLLVRNGFLQQGHKQNKKLTIWSVVNIVKGQAREPTPSRAFYDDTLPHMGRLWASADANETTALHALALNLAIRQQASPVPLITFIKEGLRPGIAEPTLYALLVALGLVLTKNHEPAIAPLITEDFFGSLVSGNKFSKPEAKDMARNLRILFQEKKFF